jgi:hypothetical protein
MKEQFTLAMVLNFMNVVFAALAKRIMNRDIVRPLKTLTAVSGLFFVCGCASLHSPYDLHDWCVNMGSSRLASIGPAAQDPKTCQKELDEDLADPTPRILYVPRDVAMSPVITARALWVLLGRTRPPF